MTENKTEKRRVVTRLCIALVVLTLLSCCFLGSTFAKYVTGGSGNLGRRICRTLAQCGADFCVHFDGS